ncbi:MAG: hypothetical protein EBZ11_01880, partial [Alphaproteobacteria bacterium]|nr:hypothetical protein [Alphaproteobacteria bacterium]
RRHRIGRDGPVKRTMGDHGDTATHRLPVRGCISMITHCPFDGPIAPDTVAALAARMMDLGCCEVALGDTVGRATPAAIARLLEAVVKSVSPRHLAGHYHDTGGHAVANISASLPYGLRCFDASVGGLGGCPYAPGAAGNVASEAVAHMLAGAGFATGLDLDALGVAAEFATSLRGETPNPLAPNLAK